MKLSHAILLGDSLRTRHPWKFLDMTTEPPRGCALGGAALAVGDTSEHGHLKHWPWLTDKNPSIPWGNAEDCIGLSDTLGFVAVCRGLVTLEQLVDYVASIEPECGECNQFQCICDKVSDSSLVETHAHPI